MGLIRCISNLEGTNIEELVTDMYTANRTMLKPWTAGRPNYFPGTTPIQQIVRKHSLDMWHVQSLFTR